VQKRKLIEVALPLEAINAASVREKSIRQGHPSGLHLWWSRKPLATARAVLFAQLVDDPSARPEEFATEELQRNERERLHSLIERLVVWENLRDERLLAEARAEISKSTGGVPPTVFDPFAGGGSIPLEAERLGLNARAADLNPVAVLINKALIELPPPFRDHEPVFPGVAPAQFGEWNGYQGLAADVREYGGWLRTEAEERIGHMYPDLDGLPVIAWLWARTITCPNPACRIEMPLTSKWWIGQKRGNEAWVIPTVVGDSSHPSGLRVDYSVVTKKPTDLPEPTMSGRHGGSCVACGSVVAKDYIKAEGSAGRMGSALMVVVAQKARRRMYFSPTREHLAAAQVGKPEEIPVQEIGNDPRALWTPLYGFTRFADLFTDRQLMAMSTLCDLVVEVHDRVMRDGGSPEYATAVATYLGLGVSRTADLMNSIVTWSSSRDQARSLFARQAIPMSWDFVEVSPFAGAAGDVGVAIETMATAFANLPTAGEGSAFQQDAATADYHGVVLSTDPPYYDNIGYSDLSDFFYVWLRRSLRAVHPELLSTLLVPKAEELVANPYRQAGKAGAKSFFEDGFRRVFSLAREAASDEFPITVYYAFKQSDADEAGEVSTGWETLLEGMVRGGWEITSTWPMRSERGGRMLSVGTNALASSIVLSLRPRREGSPTTDRRGLIAALKAELPDALRKLQQGQIAPVDLPQAAIGPGMAVFSRYGAVLEPDGNKMSVRAALARINEILDQVLNEQEGDFDATSRFALAWYRGHGYGVGKFGDADNLARARNTSVDVMNRDEILTSRAGNVQIIKPADLPWDYDVLKDTHTSNWEALHHLIKVLERDGIAPAGDFLQAALSRPDGAVDPDLVKELAHLLFRVAESKGWIKDALSFNTLVTSWPEILEVARSVKKRAATQRAFEFDEGDES
jgi:putative DNA methylase